MQGNRPEIHDISPTTVLVGHLSNLEQLSTRKMQLKTSQLVSSEGDGQGGISFVFQRWHPNIHHKPCPMKEYARTLQSSTQAIIYPKYLLLGVPFWHQKITT